MNQLAEKSVDCPYCGETIDILIDTLIDSDEVDQQYIEDCQVCCKPITFLVTESEYGEFVVRVYSEDEVY